jgi:hypothetical protein
MIYPNILPIPSLQGHIQDVYFGCDGQTGHYHFWAGMRSASREIYDWFRNPNALDGAFTPRKDSSQGAVALHHYPNYTIFSFHDYTVDSRPGSHSTFVLHHSPKVTHLIFEECLQRALVLFKPVIDRNAKTNFRVVEIHWHDQSPPPTIEPK